MQNKYFKLFTCCKIVKGYGRSLICDLQRNQYHFIPNKLVEILNFHANHTIGDIQKIYGQENEARIEEYFHFLLSYEYIFLCSKDELNKFPDINEIYDQPTLIDNALIDHNQSSKHDYQKLFNQLSYMNCKFIQLRFYDLIDFVELEKTLSYLEGLRIIYVEVYMKYPKDFSEAYCLNLLNKFPRLRNLVFHSAPKNQFINQENHNAAFWLLTQEITSNHHCGFISMEYFTIHLHTFNLSKSYNSCLYKKLSIDTNGDIKNCPSMLEVYGNIYQGDSLYSALMKKDFKQYWEINKDQIEICKDCEFRYICTDCRAFIQNPDDRYSKPSKCSYDPYTTTWK
ncbi:MAG: grasp-with-spasm system SPASM domain peptide maturase [Microscillaceae bacterium]|nr:grasp-with-spasm system SPASM domain peptide maturase [Microscillaceae bacterium]